SRYAQPRAGLRPRWNAYVHSLRMRHAPVSVTRGACVLELAGPAAPGTREVEPHGARHLRNVPCTVTLRAHHSPSARQSRSIARCADILPADAQLHLRAADGFPEADAESI